MSARVWLVMPTYNEAENIEAIVRAAGVELERTVPGEHRILISRQAAMDELLLRVEADAATFQMGVDAISGFRGEVERKLRTLLGLRTVVEVVEPGSIPRTDFKARRVIDDRKVFADMHAQMERRRS